MGYTKAQYIEKFGEDYYYNVIKPNNKIAYQKYIQTEKGKANRKKQHTKWHNEHDDWNKWEQTYPEKNRAKNLTHSYNQKDIMKGFDTSNNITADWIVEKIFSGQKCIYCGDSEWQHLGCDRIDNSKPHTPDNVVCACGICNIERGDKYSVEDFIQYRQLHPRLCDQQKTPLLNKKGALIKKSI